MNRFEDGGNSVAEQARGLKEEAKDRASGTVKEQMDTRSTQAGEQMQKVAGAMRQSSNQLREQAGETPAKVNDAVAEKVEQLSTYLTNANANTMLSDLENVARRRPWLVAGAATVALHSAASCLPLHRRPLSPPLTPLKRERSLGQFRAHGRSAACRTEASHRRQRITVRLSSSSSSLTTRRRSCARKSSWPSPR